MKVDTIHIHYPATESDPFYISAEIEVPGLGKVTIQNCLSENVLKQIESEAIFALEQRLNIKHEVIHD